MFCQYPVSIDITIVLWCACTIITILFGFATGVSIGVIVAPVAIVMADNNCLVHLYYMHEVLTIVFLANESWIVFFCLVLGSFVRILTRALSDNSEPGDNELLLVILLLNSWWFIRWFSIMILSDKANERYNTTLVLRGNTYIWIVILANYCTGLLLFIRNVPYDS